MSKSFIFGKDDVPEAGSDWVEQLAECTGVSSSTCRRHWQRFCLSTKRSCPPSKATKADLIAFSAWTEAKAEDAVREAKEEFAGKVKALANMIGAEQTAALVDDTLFDHMT